MTHPTMLPLIFLFDMDHTIVGNCEWQVARYDLSRKLAQKHDVNKLKFELENGLLRPHFESCFKLIRTKYPNAEIYVFTAAEKNWAHVMITSIEKMLGIQFNRPIFSRENCVNEDGILKKHIGKLAPAIYRKLKTSYKLSHISQLKKQIILVDNNMVIGPHDSHRFVQCNSYVYAVPCDVFAAIPSTIMESNINNVLTVLRRYPLFSKLALSTDIFKLYACYYTFLAEAYKQSSSSIQRAQREKDVFWLLMERIFRNHNVRSFNQKVVNYINKNVSC